MPETTSQVIPTWNPETPPGPHGTWAQHWWSCYSCLPTAGSQTPTLASLPLAARVLRGCRVDGQWSCIPCLRVQAGWGPVQAAGPSHVRVPHPRFVILSVVLFGLVYNPHEACSLNLVDHGRGYLGILLSCMIAEMAIIWLSMRGGILYTEPRESMQYVLYVRLGKGHCHGWALLWTTPTSTLLLGSISICRAHAMGQPCAMPGCSSEPADSLGSCSRPGAGTPRPRGRIWPDVCFGK